MREIWKAVSGFEEFYEVSNIGRVRSWKNGRHGISNYSKILKPGTDGGGYLIVFLSKNKIVIRRHVAHLIIETFTGNRPEGMEVNHLDGIKTNNSISNLKYCTSSQNKLHAFRNGLNHRGEKHPNSILSESDVFKIRKLLYHKKPLEIAKIFKVSKGAITGIKSGVNWAWL